MGGGRVFLISRAFIITPHAHARAGVMRLGLMSIYMFVDEKNI